MPWNTARVREAQGNPCPRIPVSGVCQDVGLCTLKLTKPGTSWSDLVTKVNLGIRSTGPWSACCYLRGVRKGQRMFFTKITLLIHSFLSFSKPQVQCPLCFTILCPLCFTIPYNSMVKALSRTRGLHFTQQFQFNRNH